MCCQRVQPRCEITWWAAAGGWWLTWESTASAGQEIQFLCMSSYCWSHNIFTGSQSDWFVFMKLSDRLPLTPSSICRAGGGAPDVVGLSISGSILSQSCGFPASLIWWNYSTDSFSVSTEGQVLITRSDAAYLAMFVHNQRGIWLWSKNKTEQKGSKLCLKSDVKQVHSKCNHQSERRRPMTLCFANWRGKDEDRSHGNFCGVVQVKKLNALDQIPQPMDTYVFYCGIHDVYFLSLSFIVTYYGCTHKRKTIYVLWTCIFLFPSFLVLLLFFSFSGGRSHDK